MNLLDFFREFLLTREPKPSHLTVKNYLADVRKFIIWFEATYHTAFTPEKISGATITRYKEEKLSRIRRGALQPQPFASASSVDRYMSSLRKFFSCLKENGLSTTSPFDLGSDHTKQEEADKWHLKAFKNYLYITNNSPLTIKNYIMDIRQFLEWAEKVTESPKQSYIVDRRTLYEKLDTDLVEEYKNRLLHESQISPVSINRKLSSLRRYFSWAYKEKLIRTVPAVSGNILQEEQKVSEDINFSQSLPVVPLETPLQQAISQSNPVKEITYSKFPPLRLMQKMGIGIGFLIDAGLIIPLVAFNQKAQYLAWLATGKKLFSTSISKVIDSSTQSGVSFRKTDPIAEKFGIVPNLKKSLYEPYRISTAGLPFYKKVIHLFRHNRPKWYKRYHRYAFVHYIHFALLIIVMSAIGFGLYRAYWPTQLKQSRVLAASVSPPRLLSFQGRLTDSKDTPITANSDLRFAIYNGPTGSGSAMLWQEIQTVKPDIDGIFTVLLGKKSSIPQSLFAEYSDLYLGISVNGDTELVPRQQLATVAYATNAELLQGMPAITQTNAGTANVILALDSAGNLAIGGTASPTFQATGGTFTLSGKVLTLTSTTGSNGNVIISPDGTGKIDVQKPLQNTGNGNTLSGISGAVEVDDTLGILASEGQPALAIDQQGSGPILTASKSGTTKFRVGNDGTGYFAGGIGINEINPNSKLYINSGNDAVTASFNTTTSSVTLFRFLTNGTQYAAFNKNDNGDVELTTADTQTDILLNPLGNVGIGTTDPNSFRLQVSGSIGPNADSQSDIGSSSKKFSSLYVNNIYTGTTGVVGFLQRANGALFPTNIADDLLLGGSSTGSAQFAFSNVAGGTPTAFIGGNLNLSGAGIIQTSGNQQLTLGGNSTGTVSFAPNNVTTLSLSGSGTPTATINGDLTLNSAGTIQTTSNQTLTIGGNNTGMIQLSPNGTTTMTLVNGNVGIGTTNVTAPLTVNGNTTVSGNVGVGTTAPQFGLDVQNSQNATAAAQIYNSSTSADADGLVIKLGNTDSATISATNRFVSFETDGIGIVGGIQGNGGSNIAFQTNGIADFAEYIKKDPNEAINYGDLVCNSSTNSVIRCSENAKSLVGVMSDSYTVIGGDPRGAIPVGVTGIVMTKVSTANGAINPGDYVTVSGQSGVAIKATKTGEVLGKAIEGFDGDGVKRIKILVRVSWYDPTIYLTDTGNLSISQTDQGTYSVKNNNEIIDQIGALKEAVIGTISTGMLRATEVSAEKITVAGMSLHDYILSVVPEQTQTKIISPLDGKLAVNVISPIGDSNVSVNLSRENVSVKNGKGQTVAGIDNKGNATFSGTLTAQDASVAGTLKADRVETNDLSLSDAALKKLGDRLNTISSPSATVTNITNIYQTATPSGTPILSPTPSPASNPENIASPDTTGQNASFSAALSYVPNFKSEFATVTKGLMSFGPSSLADVSVAGQLSVSGNLIIADHSINVLGADLEIQPLRQGNVSFMAGLVKIDTEGNMAVAGNANFAKNVTVKGIFAANIISPIPDKDLVFNLSGTGGTPDDPGSHIIVQNASGSAVLRINELGDLIASGSGTFKNLAAQAFNIIRGAQADTSVTETVASSSAGTAVISKYEYERTVVSPYVKADSLIYISPTSDTGGLTPYIARQTAEDIDSGSKGSFTIQIPKTTLKDIKVNWWIVN